MSKNINVVIGIPKMQLSSFKKGTVYESKDASISERLGLTNLGAVYSEVPPGKSGCPFHVHHVEDEMFVILEGEGEYQFGKKIFKIRKGDVLGAPCGGPEYAHKLTNTGKVPLKYLSISSRSDIDVCEYPDSGKFLVSSRRSAKEGERFRFIGRKIDERDYWEDEQGAEE